jgi:hypothetical protein
MVMVKNKGHIVPVRMVMILSVLLTMVPEILAGPYEISIPFRLNQTSSFILHNDSVTSVNQLYTAPHFLKMYLPPATYSQSVTQQAQPSFHNNTSTNRFQLKDYIINYENKGINPSFISKGIVSYVTLILQHPTDFTASTGRIPMISKYFYGNGKVTADANSSMSVGNLQTGSAPELICPDDISTYTDINECSAFIAGDLDPVFDETEVVNLTWEMDGSTVDASPAQGINLIGDYTFPEGQTIVIYRATGTDGSTAECLFTVTISDNQVPRLESMPGDITVAAAPGQCSNTVFWIEPTASDNCTPLYLIQKTGTHRPGDSFPVGTTRVTYRAIDAMHNESLPQSFTVTVEDRQLPVLTLPADATVECGQPLPAPWTTLQQLIAAGGSVDDNCSVDENSFRLLTETRSSTICPYTLTRTYELKDVNGNLTTELHRIYVTGEEPAPELKSGEAEEEVTLKSGMGILADVSQTFNSSGSWWSRW